MSKTISKIFVSLLVGLALAFGFNLIFMSLATRPFLDQALLILFSTASFGYLIFTMPGSSGSLSVNPAPRPVLDRGKFIYFVRENAAGLLLSIAFFLVYTSIAIKLNLPHIDTVDNFLDADNSSWMLRIADPAGGELEMRGPHPFAYLIFRPLGWILNLFTRNVALSAILFNTFAGGLAVFFAWRFMAGQTSSKTYAFLIAGLLGLSTAHLFFGSVVETYIFSAVVLIIFFVLLQKQTDSTGGLTAAGLITFGITFTNFIQNLIGFFVSRPRFKDLIRFGCIVLSLAILLSLVHAAIYPSSQLFFLPSDASGESEFQVSLFDAPAWRTMGRVVLLTRTMLLYTVIAPTPYVFGEEVGGVFPRFNFFKIEPGTFSYSSYDGLGNILIFMWFGSLLVAGVFFLRDLVRHRRADLRTTFLLCLAFNFALHLNYGYEPFLYSPDWAYALIFFTGLSLAHLAHNKLFQAGLLLFLILLACNQFQFIQFIFQTIQPFVG